MIAPLAGSILDCKPHPFWDSRRLWSLWDMIDFSLGDFIVILQYLEMQIKELGQAAIETPDEEVPDSKKRYIETAAKGARIRVDKLKIEEHLTSLRRLDFLIERKYYTYRDAYEHLERLVADIRGGALKEKFFHYPRDIVKLLENIDEDWKYILREFPQSRREIEAGIDCYAFGDYPGCIFHMTRIAEIGLRDIARQLKVKKVSKNKPVEFAMWGEVIPSIQNAIIELRNTKGNAKPLSAKQRKSREAKLERFSPDSPDEMAFG